MQLSERDRELSLLDQLYEGCTRGRGAVVPVSGAVGCGKTALLQVFGERVAERGGRFVSVAASASERLHGGGLIGELLSLMCAAGMVTAPLIEAFDREAPVDDCQDLRVPPVRLLQSIYRAIHKFAEQGPLVIGIDDVHFADVPSREALGYLIRRLEWMPVMILLTSSSCYERQLAALHAETVHLPYCHPVQLGPLSSDGILEQLTLRLRPDLARSLAWPSAQVSGGSPLLLQALADDYGAQVAAGGEPRPGAYFRDAVRRCLHRTEPTRSAVARAVAVLAEAASPSLIGAMLHLDASAVRHGLADLNAAGLLVDVRLRHEEAQRAVLEDVPPEELPRLRGKAAELLHKSGAPAAVVAWHLVAAHDGVRASWRAATLREAARETAAAGDIASAIAYLRYAASICDDPRTLAKITAALADAQWHLDPVTAVRHLPHLSHDVTVGLLRGEEAGVPVKHLLWQGDFAHANALAKVLERTAREGRGGTRPPAGASGTAAFALWLSLCYPELARVAGGRAEPAVSRPDAVGPTVALALLAAPAGTPVHNPDPVLAEQVLRDTHPGSSLAVTLLALVALAQTDRPQEAACWSARLLEQPWIRRVPVRRALLEAAAALVALRQGDPAEAADRARVALELIPPPAWGVLVGIPLALAICAATKLGDLPAAMAHLRQPVPPAMFDTPFALPYLQATGRYHLAAGRPDMALSTLQSCGELMVRWQVDAPDLADWRNDAAEALIALGRVRHAQRLLEEQLARAGDRFPRVQAAALRLMAAASNVRVRVPLLEEAVKLLDAFGDRLELGRAQAELDATLDLLGAEDAAAQARGPAARGTGDRAGNAGVPGESGNLPAELTDAECRVAALAIAGRTNRQIADELFITVSTVEQHLTKIYRKLKVRRRADLSARLLPYDAPEQNGLRAEPGNAH